MIRWTRSARIAPGKFLQAVQFAKEISDYAKKFQGAPPVSVYLDSFGEIGTIRWFADYEDVAAWEKVANQLYADLEFINRVNQAADLFIPGSVHDSIMRSI